MDEKKSGVCEEKRPLESKNSPAEQEADRLAQDSS